MGGNGWEEGREKARPLSGRLFDRLSSRISFEQWTPSDEGDFFSVEDVLSGEPECWRTLRTFDGEGVARRQVRIAVCGVASGCVHGEALAARGAAIVALVDLLETAGFGVSIDLAMATGTAGMGIICDTVKVKGYDERADLGMLAFWLGHPAASRRLGFAGFEGRPQDWRSAVHIGFGYGRVCNPDADPRLLGYTADLVIPGPDTFIPGTYDEWKNPDGATRWIKTWLENLGVRFLD
jgi:hypothetical protein